eukprot:4277444-Amphidinium_carterae.1
MSTTTLKQAIVLIGTTVHGVVCLARSSGTATSERIGYESFVRGALERARSSSWNTSSRHQTQSCFSANSFQLDSSPMNSQFIPLILDDLRAFDKSLVCAGFGLFQ